MLQRQVGRGVIAGLVVKWTLTGRRLDDWEKICDLLVTTLRSRRSVGDHFMTTTQISDFPSCLRNFRDHFEQFKNWRSRSSAIGRDRGMVARPISATLLQPSGDQWRC